MKKTSLFIFAAMIAAVVTVGCDSSGGGGGKIEPLSGQGPPKSAGGGINHPMPGASK